MSTSPDSKCISRVKGLVRACCEFSSCIDVSLRKGDLYFVIEVGLVFRKEVRVTRSHSLGTGQHRDTSGNPVVALGTLGNGFSIIDKCFILTCPERLMRAPF